MLDIFIWASQFLVMFDNSIEVNFDRPSFSAVLLGHVSIHSAKFHLLEVSYLCSDQLLQIGCCGAGGSLDKASTVHKSFPST